MSHGRILFEDMPPHFEFKNGHFDVFEQGAPPTRVIRTDKNWGVKFHWEILGDLCCMVHGKWLLSVYLEEMGVGEFSLPHNTMTFDFLPKPHVYDPPEMMWNAGEVPAGTYRIVTTLTVTTEDGGTPGPFAGYAEGPMLQFFEPGTH